MAFPVDLLNSMKEAENSAQGIIRGLSDNEYMEYQESIKKRHSNLDEFFKYLLNYADERFKKEGRVFWHLEWDENSCATKFKNMEEFARCLENDFNTYKYVTILVAGNRQRKPVKITSREEMEAFVKRHRKKTKFSGYTRKNDLDKIPLFIQFIHDSLGPKLPEDKKIEDALFCMFALSHYFNLYHIVQFDKGIRDYLIRKREILLGKIRSAITNAKNRNVWKTYKELKNSTTLTDRGIALKMANRNKKNSYNIRKKILTGKRYSQLLSADKTLCAELFSPANGTTSKRASSVGILSKLKDTFPDMDTLMNELP